MVSIHLVRVIFEVSEDAPSLQSSLRPLVQNSSTLAALRKSTGRRAFTDAGRVRSFPGIADPPTHVSVASVPPPTLGGRYGGRPCGGLGVERGGAAGARAAGVAGATLAAGSI